MSVPYGYDTSYASKKGQKSDCDRQYSAFRRHTSRVADTPAGCAKPSESALYMSVGLCLAGLDIRSFETRHEMSAESSKPPGYDGITSRYLLPVHTRSTPEGAKSVDFVTKSALHTSLGLQLAGLDIISIETRHETSEEPSRSPGDDDITSRYLLPVL